MTSHIVDYWAAPFAAKNEKLIMVELQKLYMYCIIVHSIYIKMKKFNDKDDDARNFANRKLSMHLQNRLVWGYNICVKTEESKNENI